MNEDAVFSEKRFNEIIAGIDQSDWILANVARLVYYAGFHKNEIEKIKIWNVFRNNNVLSIIEPFLEKSRKIYTSLPIILNPLPRTILAKHIKQLEREGYAIDDEAPLFPDPKTREKYNAKTLQRRFKNYFKDITFYDLRKFGCDREKRQLKSKYGNNQDFKNQLLTLQRNIDL